MLLGVDYYPEQWDSSLMDNDMDTMLEMGCNVIRIGEFSWHLMEKTEGQYDFSFFDKVIGLHTNIPIFYLSLKAEKNARLAAAMSIVLTAQLCITTLKRLFVLW